MSDLTTIRYVGFADAAGGAWGAAVLDDGGGGSFVAFGGGPPAPPDAVPVELEASDSDAIWALRGPGLELRVEPWGPAVENVIASSTVVQQGCRVTGRSTRTGEAVEIDARGDRTAFQAMELAGLDSLRCLTASFDEGASYAVSALRPRRAKGHDRDEVFAALLAPDSGRAVAEPRLSTTYGDGGPPLRAGLELWLDGESDDEEHLPHRLAGEADGERAQLASARLTVELARFRWHGRGREGSGVYALAVPR